MEVKRERIPFEIVAFIASVSILVLMEVKREGGEMACGWELIVRFNPCFDGSEARGCMSRPFPDRLVGFNPCFDGSEARVRALA